MTSTSSPPSNNTPLKLEDTFARFDQNRDGYICASDLQKILLDLGHSLTLDEVNRLITRADVDGDNRIDYFEFVKLGELLPKEGLQSEKDFIEFWMVKFLKPEALSADSRRGTHESILNTAKVLFAGAVAGAVSRTVASPFERTKILFQVSDLMHESKLSAHVTPRYHGIAQTLARIFKEEGLRGYFKGNGTNVVRIIPYSAVQYYSYSEYKRIIMEMSGDVTLHPRHEMMAGALAGVTSIVVSYPLDLIRCRLSAQAINIKYTGIGDAFFKIYHEEGLRGLYRGLNATLIGIAPYNALNFTAYEELKRMYKGDGDDRSHQPSTQVRLCLGAVAGAFSQTVTYPFDVVRRRMQMVGFGADAKEHGTMLSTGRYIVRAHGWTGLYKGLLSNYLKVVPTVSVSFVVYEEMKEILKLSSQRGL